MYGTSRNSINASDAFLLIVGALMVALVVFIPISIYKCSASTETVTVIGKEVKNDVYMVYTENETFCISDDVLSLRFDSSDCYGAIELGETYEVDAIGFRIKPLSVYRNILSAE